LGIEDPDAKHDAGAALIEVAHVDHTPVGARAVEDPRAGRRRGQDPVT
jgi:hypothetical protein